MGDVELLFCFFLLTFVNIEPVFIKNRAVENFEC